tara:strand:- start:502 stop:744 length:243 start_codon:yes stop_codon:yes gene_type:complete
MSHFGDIFKGASKQKPTPVAPPVVTPPTTVEPETVTGEVDLKSLSKKELEDYGRTVGIELDRRHSRSKLVKELQEHIDNL